MAPLKMLGRLHYPRLFPQPAARARARSHLESARGTFCALDSNLGGLFAFVSIVLIVPRIIVAHISVIMAAQEKGNRRGRELI